MARDYGMQAKGAVRRWRRWGGRIIVVGSLVAGIFFIVKYYKSVSRKAVPNVQTAVVVTAQPIKASAPKAPSGRPRFEFYQLLPKQSTERTKSLAPEALPMKAQVDREYWLQIALFRRQEDAQHLLDKLQPLGFKAKMQSVTIQQSIRHQVVLGPFTSKAVAEQQRAQLLSYQYRSILFIKPTPKADH